MNTAAKNIAKLLQSASYSKNSWDVFSDCVAMMSYSISNSFDKSQFDAREKAYMDIVARYQDKELVTVREIFPRIMAELTMGLEAEATDILGRVFEEAELSNSARGQFFTPWSVSQLMAEMQLADGFVDKIESKGFITVSEPACGAGGMVIAFAEAMRHRGLNPQQQMHVQAIDIDSRAAHMCYTQLSLLGIPAEVWVGNTLSLEMREVFRTPMHVLGGWDMRLRIDRAMDATRELLDSMPDQREVQDVPPSKADFTLEHPVQPTLFDLGEGYSL